MFNLNSPYGSFLTTALNYGQQTQTMYDQQINTLLGELEKLMQHGGKLQQQQMQEQTKSIVDQARQATQQIEQQTRQNQQRVDQEAAELERIIAMKEQEGQRKDEQINRQKKLVKPVQTSTPEQPKKRSKPKIITEFYDD